VFKSLTKWGLLTMVLAIVTVAAPVSYAAKRTAVVEKSSITATNSALDKIPAKKINLMVLGDSLGGGVWAGLYNIFRKDKNIKVTRKTKPSTGFVRLDYYDWNANLGQILNRTRIDIAVVMMGANDRQTIITKTGRFRPGSKRWREIYASRVDTFIKQLKNLNAKIYWVGLPITRRKKFTAHMRILNEIFAERAAANNIVFVDIWKDFTTVNGRYSANGKDINGRMRKLRANDGVHFTMRGYRKLASAAERYIRADLIEEVPMIRVAKVAAKPLEIKPPIKKIRHGQEIAVPKPGFLMMAPEAIEGAKIEPVRPAGNFPVGVEFEKVESLKLALSMAVRVLPPQLMNPGTEGQKNSVEIEILPKFQPNADYLAKNLQKARKKDVARVLRQALANEFQDILSIVQPDKAVVVSSRTAVAPNQEGQPSLIKVLPKRQQMRKVATLSLNSGLPGQSEKAERASQDAVSVRPVSSKSGTPDDNVEYEDETAGGQGAFTGTSGLTSVTSISGLDFKTATDAQGNLTTLAYRTLLRGDAVPPKAGRGDDFSWPRD
jgi:hypothetical protein